MKKKELIKLDNIFKKVKHILKVPNFIGTVLILVYKITKKI